MKKIYVITSLFVIFVIIIFLYLFMKIPDFEPKVTIVEIYSTRLDEKLFIKKKNWGITGDAQVIVLSKLSSEIFEPDTNRELIFKGLSPLFYNFSNDTLNLYVTQKSEVPKGFSTNIIINQHLLTNPEIMKLMKDYKDKGFKKID